MNYPNAAATYRQNAILTSSPEKIVKLLYEGAIRHLERSRIALSDPKTTHSAVAGESLSKAHGIIGELRSSLDHQVGGDIAANLDRGASQARLRLERSAGQLDFPDFVASASLDRDDVSAGAVSLRPPRSWTASAAFERRFWGEGAIVLTYSHEWIDDVVDRVAVVADEEIFDAIGNIGAGTRDTLQVELTAPLSQLGVAGLQLHASATLRRSRVTDPETGERRPISEDKPVEGEIRLTQDLLSGRLSWGVEAELAEKEQEFRFDEVRTEREQFRVSAHVDYKPHPSWRLRLEGANVTSSAITEVRTRFEGRRSGGTIDEIERRRIATTPIFLLSVRKTFGA